MYAYKPSTYDIDNEVKKVRVCNAIHGCVHGQAEEQNTGEVTDAACNSRHHFAGAERLNEDNKWHD